MTNVLDRTHAPASQPVRSFSLPTPQVQALPNHSRLHVMAHDALPAVQVQIVLRAGNWYEPAPAVALLTARGLTEGTAHHSAHQMAETIAFYGAFLDVTPGPDRVTISLYCLSRHLPSLLPLLKELLTEATYPDAEIDALRNRLAQSIRVEREKTAYLATERITRNLFGAGHPYCAEIDVEALLQTSTAALRAFYADRYRLHQAEIFVAGDVSPAHLDALQQALPFAGTSAEPAGPGIEKPDANRQDEIPMPDSLQSSVRVGRLWPGPQHPDTHRLFLLNRVLGGYFGSRLMKNIREDKGYTYGIHAGINHREKASSFAIATDVNAASTANTFTEIQHELTRLQTELIPEAELTTVKNYTIGKFLGEITSVFDQMSKYRFAILHDLPPTYYNDFVSDVQNADAPGLLALAEQYLNGAAMHEVTVGRRAGV